MMRMASVGCGSGIALRGAGWLRYRILLLFHCCLYGTKDVSYFTLERGKLQVDYAAAGVEDDVDRRVEAGKVVADRLAHAALDAIAIDGLAHDLANGESDARAGSVCVAQRCTVGAALRTQGEEVRHLLRKLFAACLVDALIVGVFAETEDDGFRGHTP